MIRKLFTERTEKPKTEKNFITVYGVDQKDNIITDTYQITGVKVSVVDVRIFSHMFEYTDPDRIADDPDLETFIDLIYCHLVKLEDKLPPKMAMLFTTKRGKAISINFVILYYYDVEEDDFVYEIYDPKFVDFFHNPDDEEDPDNGAVVPSIIFEMLEDEDE